ncbi:MAG: efflux RND transporter permease subunit [Bacteroidales bacterium]|nr:efflux RND transporter permease subunit [Bacteroidales bacterium]
MIRFLISRPIAVTMVYLAILILGVVATSHLPVSLMPDVDIPKITVQVSVPNSTAREIENTTVKTLRQSLMQVSRLSDIKSRSLAGSASIEIEFEYGTDIDFAFIEVNEKIDRAMSAMPRNFERPRVIKASATDIPVFYLNVSLKKGAGSAAQPAEKQTAGSELYPVSQQFADLSLFANQVIRKRIEQLPSVSLADISGQVFPEILLVPDNEKLKALGIGQAELESALHNNNIDLGNLIVRDGQYQFNIRAGNRLLGKDDIANVPIRKENRVYKLKDLAQVVYHPQTLKGMVKSDSSDALIMAIIKQSNARMADLKKELNGLMDAFGHDYPNLEFTITRNQTQLLEYSIGNMKQSLYAGAILAFLVMFFFLKDYKSPLLIGLTMPVSLIVSLLCFHIAGISLNVVSLSGLVLGIGMMIDNSIIVIDNIHQHRQRGSTLDVSCINGTNEVFRPLLSSVLTTCAVFVPLIFIGGITGAIFYDQAIAVTIGLFVSLAVSITLLPVYYYLVFKKWPALTSANFFTRLNKANYETLYEKGLNRTFRYQKTTWALVLCMFAGIILLYRALPKEKFPPITKNDLLVRIDWNEQVNIETNNQRVCRLIESLKPHTKQTTSLIGEQQFLLGHRSPSAGTEALVYIESTGPENLAEIQASASNFFKGNFPGAIYSFEEPANIFELLFGDNTAKLEARLYASTEMGNKSDEKLNLAITGLQSGIAETASEPVAWDKQVLLKADAARLLLYHVSYENLYRTLRKNFRENTILTITSGQTVIPVVLGDKPLQLQQIIDETNIRNANGEDIPLRMLLTIEEGKTIKTIIAGQEGEYYPLGMNVEDKKVAGLINRIRETVARYPGFSVSFAGSYFSNRKLVKELSLILAISLLLLYFILASQFESLLLPFIVLLEVPIDIFGAFLFLKIFGSSINLMSMIGIVVMSGIIINDSILKIDTIKNLRQQGYPILRAIYTGGQRRLKPILMTSLTTILALVPFLFVSGMGSDLQRPMAYSIIGGMVTGTLVSLFIIPLGYYYLEKLESRFLKSKKI